MRHEIINPVSMGAPAGYSNGVLAAPGRLLFVAGQIGWDSSQTLVSKDFAPQFAQALLNVVEVVRTAGGSAADICRLTIYVTDKKAYLKDLRTVGKEYRAIMGRNYPTMALVEVADLLEEGAMVEIEATGVIPEGA